MLSLKTYNILSSPIQVRCWEIQANGTSVPKAEQKHTKPILSCCWHNDGSKVFTAGGDNEAKIWDLASNQAITCAKHEAPIKTIHWIKAPNYECLMTGRFDIGFPCVVS